jgi:uracil-DNA glycosylase
VLLLNAVLTVSPGRPASHAGKGWERFTDRAIGELSQRREGVVFLLWGRYAQQKGAVVDTGRHHVLTAAHPSPFSASNGFFGCRHFSRTNALLEAGGDAPLDWRLP